MERSSTTKTQKEFDRATGQKVNIHCALCMASMHALMTSIKQEVFKVIYARSSEERCRILNACHVDLTSGHMGVKRILPIAVYCGKDRSKKGYRNYGKC